MCEIFAKTLILPIFSEKKIVFAGTADLAQFKIQRDIQMNSFLIKVELVFVDAFQNLILNCAKKYLSILFLGQTM